jgi:hypothetical protein
VSHKHSEDEAVQSSGHVMKGPELGDDQEEIEVDGEFIVIAAQGPRLTEKKLEESIRADKRYQILQNSYQVQMQARIKLYVSHEFPVLSFHN